MVNDDGESTYPNNETWMTDGYGDYIRHYLRAMEAFPDIAPQQQNHLVSTSSVIKRIVYSNENIQYDTFDNKSVEILRLKSKPKTIQSGAVQLLERKSPDQQESWEWKPLEAGGILKIVHQKYNKISIHF
jgi:hypothetical protein